MKRFLDLSISLILLILLLPLFLLIAFLVKVDSPGSILFKQERVGKDQLIFIIIKFRTLVVDSAKNLDSVVKDDIRVTRIGRFLRSTYLDELPQLWNVLVGDMSLVGPRPDEVSIANASIEKIHGYINRLAVRPGITGPNQIIGRIETSRNGFNKSLSIELDYIKNQNLLLDLKILLNTLLVIFKKQGI